MVIQSISNHLIFLCRMRFLIALLSSKFNISLILLFSFIYIFISCFIKPRDWNTWKSCLQALPLAPPPLYSDHYLNLTSLTVPSMVSLSEGLQSPFPAVLLPSPTIPTSNTTMEDELFEDDDIFILNTNFDPHLIENQKFPTGRSKEERMEFTVRDREHVEKHVITPSTLEELAVQVRIVFDYILVSQLFFRSRTCLKLASVKTLIGII